jgi:hypothetical protein
VKHHNPLSFFSDVVNQPQQAANILPFSRFAADVASGIFCTSPPAPAACLPHYAFIVPNTLNDGENCPNAQTSCSPAVRVADSDAWLQANIAPLLASQNFQQSGLLAIIYDEAESDSSFGLLPSGGGGHVLTLLLGAGIKAGYAQQTPIVYDHRSLLRLTMDTLEISTQMPVSDAAQMTEFFQ